MTITVGVHFKGDCIGIEKIRHFNAIRFSLLDSSVDKNTVKYSTLNRSRCCTARRKSHLLHESFCNVKLLAEYFTSRKSLCVLKHSFFMSLII